MEPRAGAAQALSEEPDTASLSRARLAAGVVLLFGLAFIQQGGGLIADTKFDLALDPGGFLARAAHLWDAEATLGQLQNQGYGYWWPMGPFFWVAEQVGLGGWVAQRLWIGLVLSVAFLGAALVARALGVRSELACLVAGAAYATSPRLVSIIGGISIEAWPSAVAPWVLLPLVLGAASGSPRRAAALSALAVGAVGGVNAAASAAVLPLGVVWLLTRTAGPRRRSMLLWWPVFTFLATAWWLVPLFLLGSYSPPFLDWIESASVTTFPTAPFDVLRGTSAWIPYVDSTWLAGNDLLRQFHLVLNSALLLTLGVLGVGHHRNPHRLFLALSVAAGLVVVSLGHLGSVQGWFAELEQGWLDGVLAPLRNIHKFDPLVRLPLVLGLAWWLDRVLRASPGPGSHRPVGDGRAARWSALVEREGRRASAVFVVVLAVATTASPMILGRLAPTGAVAAVPDHWSQTASWLADQSDSGTALLVPGSGFGTYQWGRPRDEPMQALAESPWVVRNAVPLAPAGTIRMLDAVEERLAQGHGSPGLVDFLRRAGISHLVVRNDLARSSDVPDPVLVHQAIEQSPGLGKVAQFGPAVGGPPLVTTQGRRVLLNGGWQATYPSIEIYAVGRTSPRVTSTATPTTVIGGSEDLLDLTDLGLLGSAPSVLAVDAEAADPPPGPVVLTDGLQDRERFFGRVHDTVSPVREPGAPRRTGNPVPDYLLDDTGRWTTTAELTGLSLETTSSAADAGTPGGARPGYGPWAAVDGDPDSAFRSSADDSDPSWRMELDDPVAAGALGLRAGQDATSEQRVRVVTDGGLAGTLLLRPGERRSLPLEAETTSWVELSLAGGDASQLDIAEVDLPGVEASRVLRTPAVPSAWGAPDAIVLRANLDHRTGCARLAGDVRCSPEQPRTPSEEPGALRRSVTLPEAATYDDVRILVRPDPDRAASLVQEGQLATVTGSSTQYDDPRSSPVAAVDRRRATSWLADVDDARPELGFGLLQEREVSGIQLWLDPTTAARAPERVRVSWPGGARVVDLDAEGRARFPRPFVAAEITVEVVAADDAASLGFDGETRDLPVGITALRLRGVPELPLRLGRLPADFGCGSGPTLRVDGRSVPTTVQASPVAVLLGESIEARPCTDAPVPVPAGESTIELDGDGDFLPDTLVLGDVPRTATGGVDVVTRGPVVRELTGLEPGELTGLQENANAGWQAVQDGQVLTGAVVDGWRQGWWADSAAPVRAAFAPDLAYRWALVGGAGLAAVLLAVVLLSRRWTSSAPAVGPRTLPRGVTALAAVGVAGLLAGWPGAVLAALVAWPVARWSASRPAVPATLAAALVLAAGAGYSWRPWGGSEGFAASWAWPGLAVVVAVAVVLTAAGDGRAPRFRSRRKGSSTTR